MALFWYAAAAAALVLARRLSSLHAVHSLLFRCRTRTDTRSQSTFINLRHLFLTSSVRTGGINVTFARDTPDDVVISVPPSTDWATLNVRHSRQDMCRQLRLESGRWYMQGLAGGGRPAPGLPERVGWWQQIALVEPAGPVEGRIRRSGSIEAQQLDHVIASAAQDAELFFALCTTPIWLRVLYKVTKMVSGNAADGLVRRALWVQIRALLRSHGSAEYCGTWSFFRYYYFMEPRPPPWVERFEEWSEDSLSRGFLTVNGWMAWLMGMAVAYPEYELVIKA